MTETATETLLSADIRGVDSHGVARLIGYVRLWEAGRINATVTELEASHSGLVSKAEDVAAVIENAAR